MVLRRGIYYTNWNMLVGNNRIIDLPAQNLTHIYYSFLSLNKTSGMAYLSDVQADTQYDESFIGPVPRDLAFQGGLGQLVLLKRRFPHIKTIMSIGGYGTDADRVNAHFTNICANQTLQAIFVNSVVNITRTYMLDGVDIDWEYPETSADRVYLANLLADLRSGFSPYRTMQGYTYEISMPITYGPSYGNIAQLSSLLDQINLMTYDIKGSWSSCTGHHTNLYNGAPTCEAASSAKFMVDYFVSNGLDKTKTSIGMAAYAHAFGAVANVTNGYSQSFDNSVLINGDTPIYKSILPMIQSGTLAEQWDALANATFAYDSANRVFYTYDTTASIARKSQYVLAQNLNGIFGWESSGDTNDFSLIGAMGAAWDPLVIDDAGFWDVNGTSVITTISTSTTKDVSNTSTTTVSAPMTSTVPVTPTPGVASSNALTIGITVAGAVVILGCIAFSLAWLIRKRHALFHARSKRESPVGDMDGDKLRAAHTTEVAMSTSVIRSNSLHVLSRGTTNAGSLDLDDDGRVVASSANLI